MLFVIQTLRALSKPPEFFPEIAETGSTSLISSSWFLMARNCQTGKSEVAIQAKTVVAGPELKTGQK